MLQPNEKSTRLSLKFQSKLLMSVIAMMLIASFNIFSLAQTMPASKIRSSVLLEKGFNDSIKNVDTDLQISKMPHNPAERPKFAKIDSVATIASTDSIVVATDSISIANDSIANTTIAIPDSLKFNDDWQERETTFIPNPTRAVWLSALFPGLGQIYNRRYWKLPIVVGAYMGLGYATSWNNRMLDDYTRAYRDIMDTDPSTKSYMDFFPPTIKEEDLDKSWLTNTLKSRKNYFRQNRDLCIICMVGVYLLAMVDAYVDASLSQFDLSPDLSLQVAPTLIQDSRQNLPAVGVHWAFCF